MGHLNIAKLLLDEGADVDNYNSLYGETALHTAAYENRQQIISLLLEFGADPSITNVVSLFFLFSTNTIIIVYTF